MNLSQLQRERNEWINHNFPDWAPHQPIMGGSEELLHELLPLIAAYVPALEALGRLNRHFLKAQQGIRGSSAEHEAEVKDALADTVIFLCGVATAFGFDFGECVQQAWDEVKQRDWIKYPGDGRTY
jgi:hypothetical protein